MHDPRRTASKTRVKLARTAAIIGLLFSASPWFLAAQVRSELEGRRPGGFVDCEAFWRSWTPTEGDTLVRQVPSFALPAARLGNGVLGLNGDVRWLTPYSDTAFPESGAEVPGGAAAFKVGLDHTALYRNVRVSRSGSSGPASSSDIFRSEVGIADNGLLRVSAGERDAWRYIIAYAPRESEIPFPVPLAIYEWSPAASFLGLPPGPSAGVPADGPGGERDAWRLFIIADTSMENDTPFPVPLAAYEWRPTASFRMNLGLPLLVFWRPFRHLTLTASYAPVSQIDAAVDLAVAEGPLSLFVCFANTDKTYAIDHAEVDSVRLHSGSTVFKTGLRLAVSERESLRIGIDYFFARSLVLGESLTNDRIDSGEGFSVQADYRLRF